MEMKPGYKQTEVGVFPEEWETTYLREVVDFANGKPHESDLARGGGYYLITLDSIGIEGGLKAHHKETNVWDDSLKKDDLVAVLSDLAHGNLLGLCDLIPENGKYVLNQRMGRLRLKVAADPLFIRLQINRRQSYFKKRGQGTSQRHIYKRDFDALEIPFAPPPEQRAIAMALSDVDGLLGGLDRLIAKKRDLKQAAMQQLLTGQSRLPGFRGEWELKRLGDVAEIVMGQSPISSNYNTSGVGLPLIQGNADIESRKTIKRIFTTQITKRGKSGDILLSVRAPVGEVSRTAFDVCLGRGVCAIRYDNSFLYHKLIYLEPTWAKHSKGSTFDSVNSADVKAFEIQLPASHAEQTAIALVLTEMDDELAALEQRRDKTRALKQAMMQELLTGRTRLV